MAKNRHKDFGESFLGDIIDWAIDAFTSSELYTDDLSPLHEWAQDNGYVKQADLDKWARDNGYRLPLTINYK